MPTPLHTQSTAPVLEFSCLYTRDITRKRKRWQDGTLNFHTFNRRVMVYDSTGNLVGDAHWRPSSGSNENDWESFATEADELRLQNGILVELGERRGVSETDLRPLLERRDKKDARSGADGGMIGSSPANGRMNLSPMSMGMTKAPATQINRERPKHKSLSAILKGGTARSNAMQGRAAVVESPYEQRMKLLNDENEMEAQRPAKRRKIQQQTQLMEAEISGPVVNGKNGLPSKQRIPLARREVSSEVIDLTITPVEIDSSETARRKTLPGRRQSTSVGLKSTSSPQTNNELDEAGSKNPKPKAKALKLPQLKTRAKLLCMDPDALGYSSGSSRMEPPANISEDQAQSSVPRKSSKQPQPSSPMELIAFEDPMPMPEAPRLSRPVDQHQSRTTLPSLTPISATSQRVNVSLRRIHSTSTSAFLHEPSGIRVPSAEKSITSTYTPDSSLLRRSASTFEPVIHTLTAVQANGLDVGPWSMEAVDLFDWRPPDWEDRRGKVASTVEAVD